MNIEDIKKRLPPGKSLNDFTVDIPAIVNGSEDRITIKDNAAVALEDIDRKIFVLKEVLESINAKNLD